MSEAFRIVLEALFTAITITTADWRGLPMNPMNWQGAALSQCLIHGLLCLSNSFVQ